jgi:hypothetical protein
MQATGTEEDSERMETSRLFVSVSRLMLGFEAQCRSWEGKFQARQYVYDSSFAGHSTSHGWSTYESYTYLPYITSDLTVLR